MAMVSKVNLFFTVRHWHASQCYDLRYFTVSSRSWRNCRWQNRELFANSTPPFSVVLDGEVDAARVPLNAGAHFSVSVCWVWSIETLESWESQVDTVSRFLQRGSDLEGPLGLMQ